MTKLLSIAFAAISVLFFTTLIISPVSAQKGNGGGKPIPDGVMKIAEKSCVKCHTLPGNGMALMHVNLSNWDKYSPEKQATKAKAMCNMVTKDRMPPKRFRKNNPESVLTNKEIKTICNWAQSLRVTKK